MDLFTFISIILFIDTIFMIGFIYQTVRYKKHTFITTIFTSMLVIALFGYGMAITTGEFENVQYQTNNIEVEASQFEH